MGKGLWIGVILLAMVFVPSIVLAASPWTEEYGYVNRTNAKFGFGLKNTAFGWTEILTQPVDETREGGNAAVGFGRGIFNAVGQTVGGVLHLGTFPITSVDVPLPENGSQIFSN